MCVTNGGEVRGLGVGETGGGKNVENVDVMSKVMEGKFEEVKLSLLEI